MQYVTAYLATVAVFLTVDLLWLGKFAKTFYRERLAGLLLDRFRFGVAGLFYSLYVIGIVLFAVAPALDAQRWTDALLLGSLFGFFAYGTYDMTNLATLKGWPISITIVDIAWGTFLTGMSATAGFFAARAITGH
jgi:uncharacterized membrane protein